MLLGILPWIVIAALIIFILIGLSDHRRIQSELHREKEHYRRLSTVDALTGVGNRRSLDARLEEEINRSVRAKGSFCFALVDVDKFKDINTAVGHAEADIILVSIANIIYQNIRKVDHVFRYGGDEFAIVMTNTNAARAIETIQRISSLIGSCEDINKVIDVRVSVGITEFSASSFDLGVRFDSTLVASDIISQASRVLLNTAKNGNGLAVYQPNL